MVAGPAYDVIWAWRPGNPWLDSHQMSINGKRDGFTVADLHDVGALAGLKRGRAEAILADITDVVADWRRLPRTSASTSRSPSRSPAPIAWLLRRVDLAPAAQPERLEPRWQDPRTGSRSESVSSEGDLSRGDNRDQSSASFKSILRRDRYPHKSHDLPPSLLAALSRFATRSAALPMYRTTQ